MTAENEDLRLQMVALLPRLQRFARGLAGSRDAGDDLLQQACEKALARLDQFEKGTRFDRWMFQIVKTTHIDRLRKTQRRRTADFADDVVGLVAFDARIEQQTAARQELLRVREAIRELPEDQREVLMLVVADGMSYQEASEILGVPQGTIMSRLSRARRKLARAVETAPSSHRAIEGGSAG
jgi:RNA polymerase sigma-70 factor (ECF subfamily)